MPYELKIYYKDGRLYPDYYNNFSVYFKVNGIFAKFTNNGIFAKFTNNGMFDYKKFYKYYYNEYNMHIKINKSSVEFNKEEDAIQFILTWL
jgi:hypothetical protein